jgi:hypothetical protein
MPLQPETLAMIRQTKVHIPTKKIGKTTTMITQRKAGG